MILWNIVYEEKEFNIDMDKCTILVGQDPIWYELVREIDNYFNLRGSTVQVEEDMSHIPKKDWNCYFVPFDAQLQMDKITAKSPLNEIISDCIEQLGTSPAFFELKEVWEELQEEAFFINESLQKYEIKATVQDFNETNLKSFISLGSTQPMMNPIEYKLLLLRLISERSVDKKTLIIIELPELFTKLENLIELESIVCNMKNRGFRFIIITDSPVFTGRKNYCVDNQVINEALLEMMKRKVLADAPFGVEEDQFEQAKQEVLRFVDNFVGMGGNVEFSPQGDDPVRALSSMILKQLSIGRHVDTTGFTPNILEFINGY